MVRGIYRKTRSRRGSRRTRRNTRETRRGTRNFRRRTRSKRKNRRRYRTRMNRRRVMGGGAPDKDVMQEAKEKAFAAEMAAGTPTGQMLTQKHGAAVGIQTAWRDHQAREKADRRRVARRQGDAAQRIQAVVRGHQAREKADRRRVARRQGDAAQRIQAVVRGHQARARLQEQGNAAQLIQKHQRGHQGRQRVNYIQESAKHLSRLLEDFIKKTLPLWQDGKEKLGEKLHNIIRTEIVIETPKKYGRYPGIAQPLDELYPSRSGYYATPVKEYIWDDKNLRGDGYYLWSSSTPEKSAEHLRMLLDIFIRETLSDVSGYESAHMRLQYKISEAIQRLENGGSMLNLYLLRPEATGNIAAEEARQSALRKQLDFHTNKRAEINALLSELGEELSAVDDRIRYLEARGGGA